MRVGEICDYIDIVLRNGIYRAMVCVTDGCSFHDAHTWSKSGIRFVEGIWLHRKSHQIRLFFGKRPCLHHTRATWNEQPSIIKTMTYTVSPRSRSLYYSSIRSFFSCSGFKAFWFHVCALDRIPDPYYDQFFMLKGRVHRKKLYMWCPKLSCWGSWSDIIVMVLSQRVFDMVFWFVALNQTTKPNIPTEP